MAKKDAWIKLAQKPVVVYKWCTIGTHNLRSGFLLESGIGRKKIVGSILLLQYYDGGAVCQQYKCGLCYTLSSFIRKGKRAQASLKFTHKHLELWAPFSQFNNSEEMQSKHKSCTIVCAYCCSLCMCSSCTDGTECMPARLFLFHGGVVFFSWELGEEESSSLILYSLLHKRPLKARHE